MRLELTALPMLPGTCMELRSHFRFGTQDFLSRLAECRNGLHSIHWTATDLCSRFSYSGMPHDEKSCGRSETRSRSRSREGASTRPQMAGIVLQRHTRGRRERSAISMASSFEPHVETSEWIESREAAHAAVAAARAAKAAATTARHAELAARVAGAAAGAAAAMATAGASTVSSTSAPRKRRQ